MSMLQTILGELAGGATTQQPQQQSQQNSLLECIAGLLNHPQIGGLSGLVQLFQDQGLGHLIAGWIGKGPNPPVTGDQLQQVFGSQRIAEIAQKLGIDPNQALAKLAAVLPHAVDHITPDGSVPQQGSMSTQDILTALKCKFLGNANA